MARQPSTAELSHVERKLWRACAGAMVNPPTLNSEVYYFPQGHLEQQSSSIHPLQALSQTATTLPIILCRVASVQLLADPRTDEVFAKLLLHPISSHIRHNNNNSVNCNGYGYGDGEVDSYAKVLTPSDANNGGGFSVPRFCADSIFPKLDYNVEPPLQTLVVKDLHGVVWNFRHIYRGAPRRHLLTTGWNKLVNSKKLIAGDSVVFMKNTRGDMWVGIRRVLRPSVSGEFARWREQIGGGRFDREEDGSEESDEGLAFGSGKVSGESVFRAIERAAQGLDFEVVYYPKAPWSDFVVKVEVVEEALRVGWGPGVRVKMGMETEDLSRLTWLQGTVQGIYVPENPPWFKSPWRMLQVSWDEPEATHHPSRVNPWQVEVMDPIHSTFPSSKKFRLSQSSKFFRGGEAEVFFPILGLNNCVMNQSNSSLLISNSFPAGMQGARQSSFHLSSLSNTISGSTPYMCSDNLLGKSMAQNLGSVSTELSIGTSHSGNLSPSSQSSVQSTAEKSSGKSNDSTKVCVNSIQLFGQIIHVEPDQSSSSDVGNAEDEVDKKDAENGDSGVTRVLFMTSLLTDKTNSNRGLGSVI